MSDCLKLIDDEIKSLKVKLKNLEKIKKSKDVKLYLEYERDFNTMNGTNYIPFDNNELKIDKP